MTQSKLVRGVPIVTVSCIFYCKLLEAKNCLQSKKPYPY